MNYSENDKLITFRAGIAEYDEGSQVCTPLPTQGIIKIKPNEEEEEMGFWDFEWTPTEKSPTNTYQSISLILIPGETAWIPITSTKEGRIFALRFSSNQKYFFWLQEKNKGNLPLHVMCDKDKEIFDKITKILTAPPEDDDMEAEEKMGSDEEPDKYTMEAEASELAD